MAPSILFGVTLETSTCSLTDYADRLRGRIDAALADCVKLPQGCPEKLRDAIAYSLLAPGKRLRPMLVLMAAEACGGTVEAAMPAACAVEMVHAYSLVHDDLPAMDDDDLRRGRPTTHKKCGEAMAILAGDALLPLAISTMAGGIQPPALAGRCCAVLAEAAGPCQLVGGQADDVDGTSSFDNKDDSNSPNARDATIDSGRQQEELEYLESIHNRKTGAMIRVSLTLGAMIAGTDDRRMDALNHYGEKLGLAFQVTDDLLDVCSDVQSLGKRTGKDAEQGKLTFPGLLGIEKSNMYAKQLIDDACRAIEPLGTPAWGLKALAQYVLERDH
jgi:geranylgeranyl diphosphate synthase type II